MEPVTSRMSSLNEQIQNLIEQVAQSICEGERAFHAVQVLDRLTRELIAEEHRLSNLEAARDVASSGKST